MNPLVLASVGDAVYTLFVRTRLARTHDWNAGKLHKTAAVRVCAAAQKDAFFIIEPCLTEAEKAVARRGRNTHPSTVPKSADITTYRVATALEAVLGYLYISGQCERAEELMNLIWEKQHE